MATLSTPLPLRALTLRQLQFFSVLVEEGQFGRAAKRLAITQPALSNAIKQMEKLLGAELLTRSTHRLELTPVGAEVLVRTDFLVHSFAVALRDIEGMVQRGRAFVRIGVIPSASARGAAAGGGGVRTGGGGGGEGVDEKGGGGGGTGLARRPLDRATGRTAQRPARHGGGRHHRAAGRADLHRPVARSAGAGGAPRPCAGGGGRSHMGGHRPRAPRAVRKRQHAGAGQPGARAIRAGYRALARELF